MRAFTSSLLILLAVLLSNCEHAPLLDPNQLEPTLDSIQRNIFSIHCAVSGCHLGSTAPLGLDLSEGLAWGNTVNVASGERPGLLRINPGNPDNSYLVNKIEGASDIVGERMPRGRDPLSAEQINTIREWITEGAQDN